MVASNAGSIHGSYPFVSSFPDIQAVPGVWNAIPYRGNEDDRRMHLREDAKILSRHQAAQFQDLTMPYVATGRYFVAPPQESHK